MCAILIVLYVHLMTCVQEQVGVLQEQLQVNVLYIICYLVYSRPSLYVRFCCLKEDC